MTETVWSLEDADRDLRVRLLDELDYGVEDGRVVDEEGNEVIDPCTAQPISPDNMVIFPRSTVVLDDNPVSIAWYYENYGE